MVSRRQLYNECADILKKYANPDAEFDTLCIFQDIFNEKNPLFKPMEAVTEKDEKIIREYIRKRSEAIPCNIFSANGNFTATISEYRPMS